MTKNYFIPSLKAIQGIVNNLDEFLNEHSNEIDSASLDYMLTLSYNLVINIIANSKIKGALKND